jgi:hypothetical protein
LGNEIVLREIVASHNINSARFLTPDEYKHYLDEMAELIHKGHQFSDLQRALRPLRTDWSAPG